MKQLIKIIALLTILIVTACEPVETTSLFPQGEGIFILNEGNFNAGNGTVSFYSFATGEVYNDLFGQANGRALGDIPSCLAIDGNRGFIVVNNSGTIEVVNMSTMESLGTVTGLVSPRQMVIHGNKGYVSSLQSDMITIIDIDRLEEAGSISTGSPAESMAIGGNRLFAAHWSGGNSITVNDISTGESEGAVTVGLEPESMAVDRNARLWVLCTGGWMGEEIPRLVRINTSTLEKEAEFFFRSVDDNPSSLTVNATGDTLFYLDEGVRMMPVSASELPSGPFISAGNRLFYKLLVGPGGRIAVTDAIDYQQKGDLLIYNSRGELLVSEQAGIIPGFMIHVAD